MLMNLLDYPEGYREVTDEVVDRMIAHGIFEEGDRVYEDEEQTYYRRTLRFKDIDWTYK